MIRFGMRLSKVPATPKQLDPDGAENVTASARPF